MGLPATRASIAIGVTVLYVLNWPAMLLASWIGYLIDRSVGEPIEWDGLKGVIYGAMLAAAAVHVVWAILTWRTLRRGAVPRSIVVALVGGLPVVMLATTVVLVTSGVEGLPLLAALVPASALYAAAGAWSASGSYGPAPG